MCDLGASCFNFGRNMICSRKHNSHWRSSKKTLLALTVKPKALDLCGILQWHWGPMPFTRLYKVKSYSHVVVFVLIYGFYVCFFYGTLRLFECLVCYRKWKTSQLFTDNIDILIGYRYVQMYVFFLRDCLVFQKYTFGLIILFPSVYQKLS